MQFVKFPQQWKLRLHSPGMWHLVVWYTGTNVSEGLSDSIFREEEWTTCGAAVQEYSYSLLWEPQISLFLVTFYAFKVL